jgi:hypothetical protein
MDRAGVRYGVAVAFVVLLAGPWYVDALTDYEFEGGLLAWSVFVASVLCSLAAGFLIGRWWAIPLIAVPVLVTVPLGQAPDDSDGWYYWALLVFGQMLFAAPAVLIGLGARTLARVLSRFDGEDIWRHGDRRH